MTPAKEWDMAIWDRMKPILFKGSTPDFHKGKQMQFDFRTDACT